jgi:hypothetical protein
MSGVIGDNVYRASGVVAAAGGGGAWNFISETALDTSPILITGLDSTYDTYIFVLNGIHFTEQSGGQWFQCQLYQSGAAVSTSSYNWAMTVMGDWRSDVTASYSTATTYWKLSNDGNVLTTAAVTDCILYLFNPSSTTVWPSILYSKMGESYPARTEVQYGGGQFQGTGTATTGLQFIPGHGSFDGGTLRLYGLSKS